MKASIKHAEFGMHVRSVECLENGLIAVAMSENQ